jgi:hypothetical protein
MTLIIPVELPELLNTKSDTIIDNPECPINIQLSGLQIMDGPLKLTYQKDINATIAAKENVLIDFSKKSK